MLEARKLTWSLLAALVCGAPALASAPAREVCDQADSGERIQCKFNNVLEQQRGAAEMLEQFNNVPEASKTAVMQGVERTGRAQGRAAATDFKQLTRKSQVECQVQEIVGDGKGDDDGICTAGEDCAEVLGDQIGNDDGVCKPRQGKNREICVELCDADAVQDNPANFDDDPSQNSRGRDLEETLDSLTDRYADINAMMAVELDAQASALPVPLAEGACATLLASRPSATLRAVLDGAADGARAAADVAERFCDQSAFGANTGAACAVIEGIAGVAKIVAGAVDFADSSVDSDTLDATWSCLQETSEATSAAAGAVEDVSNQVGVVDQRVQTVDQKVNALAQQLAATQQQLALVQQQLIEVTSLLNTPQGQRPEFPKGGN